MSTILLYHGVYKKKLLGIENYSCKHIEEKIFEKQIKWLRKNCELVNLKQFFSEINNNTKKKKKLVSITFDDSYKNVYTNALPILNKYEVPATFFINTGFINNSKLYWTDVLEAIFNSCEKKEFFLDAPSFSKKKYDISTNKKKIRTIIFIKNKLKKIKKREREQIVNIIKKKLNITNSKLFLSKNYKTLNWSEVKKIDKNKKYEIGGHSTNHEILSFLNETELKIEIDQCINVLEKKLKRKIDLFSYPEGKFNNLVIKKLKKKKIKICPTATPGINTKKVSSFHLKRYMPGFMNQNFPFKI